MKDEQIIALANTFGIYAKGRADRSAKEIICDFARAIADLQKEKDAKICETISLNSGTPRYKAFCEDVIRSPETDLDEALRRQ